MSDRRQHRDEELGEALRRLAVPDHRPGFAEELRARLEEAGPAAPHRRSARRSSLARGWRVAAAVALVAVGVLAVVVGGPRDALDSASAAEVRRRVVEAWASAESVSGTLLVSNPEVFGTQTRRWRFVVSARGDLRLTDTDGSVVVYDAERGVERMLSVPESAGTSDPRFAAVRRGVAPGPPDQGPSDHLLDRNLGSVVRAIAAGGEATVESDVLEGRPVWVLDTDVRVNLLVPDESPNHLEVMVDKRTAFPLRVEATHSGRVVWTTRVTDLRVDAPIAPGTFRLPFPEDAEVFETDAGFRRVGLEAAGDHVGYAPLVPHDVPDGYRLAVTAVSEQGSPTGTEGSNPHVGDVVSLAYRRGLDRFIVTTRPVGDEPERWSDPLASGEGYVDDPEAVTFSAGALDGHRGELLIDPLAVPHVWARTDSLVVTVSGDLTRDELLSVASSLRPLG